MALKLLPGPYSQRVAGGARRIPAPGRGAALIGRQWENLRINAEAVVRAGRSTPRRACNSNILGLVSISSSNGGPGTSAHDRLCSRPAGSARTRSTGVRRRNSWLDDGHADEIGGGGFIHWNRPVVLLIVRFTAPGRKRFHRPRFRSPRSQRPKP